MRGPMIVLVVSMFIGALAGPAVAQDQQFVNPLDVLIDAFDAPEGMEFVSRIIMAPIPGLSTNPDPTGDFEHTTGEDPGFTPDHIDIVDTWSLDFDAGPLNDDLFGPTDQNGFWAPAGQFEVEPPNYEPFHTFTGQEIHDGSQFDDGAILFGFTLAETPPLPVPARCEYVIWINDLSRGPIFINHPSFPRDPASGTNIAFGLRLDPEGQGATSTFAWEYQEGSGFTDNFEIDVRSFITPNYVGVMVPTSQIGELAAVNFYSFCMEEGFTFEPEMTGADQTRLIAVTLEDLGQWAIEEQDVVVPTTTTIEETTTTLVEQDIGDTTEAAAEAKEESATFPWWFLLFAGGLGVAIAGWFAFTKKGDPCKKLHASWLAADKKCDELQSGADEAADECKEAELELESLSQERKDLCKAWPPACWKTEEGSWMEDDDGNRMTSLDVHMRKMALGDMWDDYKARKLTAREVEARWQQLDTREFRNEMKQMDGTYKALLEEIDSNLEKINKQFDDLCDKAAEAREKADKACASAEAANTAYEECVGAEIAASEAP